MSAEDFVEVYEDALDPSVCAELIAAYSASGKITRGETGGGVNTQLKDSWDLCISRHPEWKEGENILNGAVMRGLIAYVRKYTYLALAPVVIKPIPDIRTFIFDTLIDDQQYVPTVLAADKKATEGRELYDDAYFADFAKNGALGVAEKRASDAASAVASVWVAAWTKAGKPKLDEPARTPARIRR